MASHKKACEFVLEGNRQGRGASFFGLPLSRREALKLGGPTPAESRGMDPRGQHPLSRSYEFCGCLSFIRDRASSDALADPNHEIPSPKGYRYALP
jgi:hypothetical protein